MAELLSEMDQCLSELGAGVDLLSAEQRSELAANGFLVLGKLLDDRWLQRLRQRFEELFESEGDRAGLEVHQEEGTRRLANLVDKGEVFDGVWSHPLLLSAVQAVIGRPFKLSSLNGRDALPGAGRQQLHADWKVERDTLDRFEVCNSIWLLDDFTPENGSTRLVPGTHRMPHPRTVLDEPAADHPQEIHLHAPAGTVAIFNSHTWHGGTLNRSRDLSRRALHCYFVAREHAPQSDHRQLLSAATRARLNASQRYLLGLQ